MTKLYNCFFKLNNKNFTNAKISNKSIKNVKAYSANSNQGIIRYFFVI